MSTMSSLGSFPAESSRASLASPRHTLVATELEDFCQPVSNLGGSFVSSRGSLATPRDTLVAARPQDLNEMSSRCPLDARDSTSSVRPTLPSFKGHVPVRSAPKAPLLTTLGAPATNVQTTTPRIKLVAVETVVIDEDGDDDWELEFLRRSQCS
jgi:hypothetical protein